MEKVTTFSHLVIEPVDNGFVVEVEGPEEDKKYIFTSTRLLFKFMKELLKEKAD